MLESLISFDKIVTLAINGSSNLYLDNLALAISSTWVWLPLALVLLYVLIRSNDLSGIFLCVAALALCITLADQGASTICKPLFERFRPTQDPSMMYQVDVVNNYRSGLYGFISSHAANTFAVAVFLSRIVNYKRLRICLYSWALLNCWSRVYLGVHFFGDVLVGGCYGALIGFCISCFFHRVQRRRERKQSLLSLPKYDRRDVSLLSFAFILTFVFVTFLPLFTIN